MLFLSVYTEKIAAMLNGQLCNVVFTELRCYCANTDSSYPDGLFSNPKKMTPGRTFYDFSV